MGILSITLIVLFVVFWWQDFKAIYKKHGSFISFSGSYKFRETLYFILLIVFSFAFVNLSGLGGSLNGSDSLLIASSVILSFLISLVWYLYLRRLDHFEKEPLLIIFITFVLGAIFSFFVFPISNFVQTEFNFFLNGEVWNDWWYCVFGIGMVEEIVKIIPFIIILKFTKQVNEPFDYIVYGSVSALGFAFIENTMYLYNSNLSAIYGRALFSSVAHMFDTSIITYGLIYLKHAKINLRGFQWIILLLLASFAHGFYDFWLINDAMNEYYFLTIFFYLLSIYLWVTMNNNLLNISPFYNLQKSINLKRIKYRIINLLLTVFFSAYMVSFLLYSKQAAYYVLFHSLQLNGFVLLFLAFNLSNMEFIKGHIGNVEFKNRMAFILPRIHSDDKHSGSRVLLFIHENTHMRRGKEGLRASFPFKATLLRRVSYQGNTNCYLIKLDEEFKEKWRVAPSYVIKLISKEDVLFGKNPRPMVLYGIKNEATIETGYIPDQDFIFIHETSGMKII